MFCACADKYATISETTAATAAATATVAKAEWQTSGTSTVAESGSEQPSDTVPTSAPAPANICTLYISCATILSAMDKLNPDKRELVPEDGLIFYSDAVEFGEGETVFDILLRETRREKIHFEFVSTPALNSVYIEGINNIYEFDCGELSGWTYKVNGEVPGYGCSLYTLSPGDEVGIVYTCDLGTDVGGDF